jgi:hypothetical protein
VSALEIWGLDDAAETVYRALLRNPDLGPAGLADALLGRLQQNTANLNPAENDLPRAIQTPVTSAPKESCTFALTIALGLATAHGNPLLLAIVGLLSFMDVIYLAETAPLSASATKYMNTFRHWGYALLNGALLLPLLLKFVL